ncbi:MAG: PilN domain-containing protein [bacterium]
MCRLYLFRFGRFLNRVYILLLLLIVVLAGVFYVMKSIQENTVRDDVALSNFNSDVADEVRRVNQILNEFEKRQTGYTTWSPRISDVLTAAPEEVLLTGLSVKEEKPEVLVVSGVSSSRPAVVAFQRRLEKLSWVKQLKAPLQNFALGSEANFTFSLHRQ